MLRPIYLDYMATTPVDPRVIPKMVEYLGPEGCFGNASSLTHHYGAQAAQAVDYAREQIGQVIKADSQEVIFTSGATEADNLAILGAARFYKGKGMHLITMSTEHKAVLDSFKQLEKEGFKVTYLTPEPDGLLDIKQLEATLQSDTILVSIMHVNNEIGVIQDIEQIGELLHNKGIIFHVDAAQSAGKLAIDLKHMKVHLMSFSAHKNYGPKGIGALYIRNKPKTRIQTLTYGGGQEQGIRSGTLATHQIVAMGEAFSVGEQERVTEQARLLTYRNSLWDRIKDIPGVQLNGHQQQRIAGNLNISFKGMNGDELLYVLHELAISTSSACAAASVQPSYVLKALGLNDDRLQNSIRLSLGRFTTLEEVDKAAHIISTEVKRLLKLAPE